MKNKIISKNIISHIISYSILIIIAAMFLLPLIWVLLVAFDKNATSAFNIPKSIDVDNFINVLSNKKNISAFINSGIISITQTIIVLICSLLAAYPLSRHAIKSAHKITLTLLFLTAIPITAVMVPVYQLFIAINLVDSIFGTIIFLSASALPYGIWMTKNFLDNVPIEIEESSWVDGASPIISLIRILIPLMLPGILTVTMFTFISSWSNFFVPFILLQSSDKIPAAVNIYRFFDARGGVIYGHLAAYSLVYMSPVFALYFFAQKYMSKGFSMSGGTKG